jgi:hypothetical protein
MNLRPDKKWLGIIYRSYSFYIGELLGWKRNYFYFKKMEKKELVIV